MPLACYAWHMYVHARVTAGAKKESFAETSPLHFVASVKEEAKQNRANRRIIELVAAHFRVPEGKVRLVSGHRSPSKILSVDTE